MAGRRRPAATAGMFDYYWMMRSRYRLPVLPIGLYLRVGLDGVGWGCISGDLLGGPSGTL